MRENQGFTSKIDFDFKNNHQKYVRVEIDQKHILSILCDCKSINSKHFVSQQNQSKIKIISKL